MSSHISAVLKATDVLVPLKGALKIIEMPKKKPAVPIGTSCLYLDWLGNPALLQVFPTLSPLHCSVFKFCMGFCTHVKLPAKALCLVLAGTWHNPKCKSKFWANTEGIICRNTGYRVSPYQHSPSAQGLCRRDEVYFRAGRKELWESRAYGDPVMHCCISAGFSRRREVCICLLAAEGGCNSFWVDIKS